MNEPSSRRPHRSHPVDLDQQPRRSVIYDSFIIRLWREEGVPEMLRAEVEHIQAGLFLEELHVPMEWIVSAMEICLRGPESLVDARGD